MAIEQIASNIFGITIPEGNDGAKAEFYLDNRDGRVRANLLPFLGGVPDASQLVFEVNNGGGVFGPRIPQPTGFKWAVTGGDFGGWELYALDLQENKYNIPDFYGEGWLLAYRFAKADAPAAVNGEIRIPKLIMSGDFTSYLFAEQPVVNNPAVSPVWNEHSWAVYHATKCHNVRIPGGALRDVYRTGKAVHIPRPRLELYDGATRKGGVWGRYEKSSQGDGTVLVTKVFDEAEVLVKVADVGAANVTHFAVDATLGYTSNGASTGLTGQEGYAGWLGDMPSGGTVEKVFTYIQFGNATQIFGAVYKGTTDPEDLVTQAGPQARVVGANWYEFDVTDEVVDSGDTIWGAAFAYNDSSANVQEKYDSVLPATDPEKAWRYTSGTFTVAPDPFVGASLGPTQRIRASSMYIEYTAAAPSGDGVISKLAMQIGIGI